MTAEALINEDLIDLNIHANNQIEVIEQLAELLEKQGRIESQTAFTQGVLMRENEVTTGFGNGIAIPHCKDHSVNHASIAIGKLTKGVDWRAMDDLDVSFVIMLAIPDSEAGTTHLQILSKLSEKLIDEDFRKQLMEADKQQDILNLLVEDVFKKNTNV
ncbi:PTS sugar transporter subunit IIA [Alteribacillus sp. JSM 102045]|uniref:PTS sugar transporter subunit IIA n=1 Tax=Alteribacillus sp. JSM 102045 TaxID=1562101 RepID=UPI0035BF5245